MCRTDLIDINNKFRPHLHYIVFQMKTVAIIPIWPSVYTNTFPSLAQNEQDFGNGMERLRVKAWKRNNFIEDSKRDKGVVIQICLLLNPLTLSFVFWIFLHDSNDPPKRPSVNQALRLFLHPSFQHSVTASLRMFEWRISEMWGKGAGQTG